MDSTTLQRALEAIGLAQDDTQQIRSGWFQLPATPGWVGPGQMAAATQLGEGLERVHSLERLLASAEAECRRELVESRRREAQGALG